MQALTPADLLQHIHDLASVPQHILYCGPLENPSISLWGESPREGVNEEGVSYFKHQPVHESEVIIAPF